MVIDGATMATHFVEELLNATEAINLKVNYNINYHMYYV